MILWIYLAAINILAFVLMGEDKKRAGAGAHRIREGTLFFVAVIGGSIGSILGMYVFRHKTKHKYFVFGMPAVLLFHALIALWVSG